MYNTASYKSTYMNTYKPLFFTEHMSVLQASFHLKRATGYYLLNVYIPCFMLVLLSWVTFFLNREASAARTSLGKGFMR